MFTTLDKKVKASIERCELGGTSSTEIVESFVMDEPRRIKIGLLALVFMEIVTKHYVCL